MRKNLNLIIVEGEGEGSTVFDSLMAIKMMKPNQIFIFQEGGIRNNKLEQSLMILEETVESVEIEELADTCEIFTVNPNPWEVNLAVEEFKDMVGEEDSNFLLISNNISPTFQLVILSSLRNLEPTFQMATWDKNIKVVEVNNLYTLELDLQSSIEDCKFTGHALREALQSLKGLDLPALEPGEVSIKVEEGPSFHIPILGGKLEVRGWISPKLITEKLITEIVIKVNKEDEEEYILASSWAKALRFLMESSLRIYHV